MILRTMRCNGIQRRCFLRLRNGRSFEGYLLGAPLRSSGEMIFTTAMVGYTESLSDPSYFGQVLVFSYPLIGNYGVPATSEPSAVHSVPAPGLESGKIHASGIILSEACAEKHHWGAKNTLDDWLLQQGIPGIVGIDTRELVSLLRENRGLIGKIEPEDAVGEHPIFGKASLGFDPNSLNLMPWVSSRDRVVFGKGGTRIALVDCGVKWNIVRSLLALGCEVELIPWETDLETVDCSGWVISNGPGDPAMTGDLVPRLIPLLAGSRPILGICLGHQLLARAAGASTAKLSYGHRSHNQPVVDRRTGRGYMTSQNHGFSVLEETLPEGWESWFVNLNDKSNEGIRHIERPFRSVQFHPEAAGGPEDTSWVIADFVAEAGRAGRVNAFTS